jgi:hypothetical protein
MDFPTIWRQLQDVPATFRREGTPYAWLIDSFTSGLYLFCQASDALQQQYNFDTSAEGWIDVWGDLAGITRNVNEPNSVYKNRIANTVLAWRDSPVAIERFIQLVENVTALVAENDPIGYRLYFPTVFDLSAINQIVLDIKYVRPAGVPFQVFSQRGTYLDTINFYGHVGQTFQTDGSGNLIYTTITKGSTIIGGFTLDIHGNLVSTKANVFAGNIIGSYFEEDTYIDNANYYGHIGTYYVTSSGGSGIFSFSGNPIQLTPPLIGQVTGAYLTGREPLPISLPVSTNNVTDIIPDLLMTDPTLNPGL